MQFTVLHSTVLCGEVLLQALLHSSAQSQVVNLRISRLQLFYRKKIVVSFVSFIEQSRKALELVGGEFVNHLGTVGCNLCRADVPGCGEWAFSPEAAFVASSIEL